MTTAAMSFLDNYDPGDFLQLNVQDNLTQFADANLDNINISGMRFLRLLATVDLLVSFPNH